MTIVLAPISVVVPLDALALRVLYSGYADC